MVEELKLIRAALTITALDSGEQVTTTPSTTVTEDAPLLPYQDYKTKPKGLQVEDLSLKPVGDLRRMKPIMDQLQKATEKITKLDSDFTAMRVDLNEKILDIQKKEGYQETAKEISALTERAASEIQREMLDITNSVGESKKILLQYGEKVWTIYDELKETSVSDKERLELLNQAMAKLLSPELVKSVNDLVNQAVEQTTTAKSEIKRKFVSWKPSKTLQKEVKEILPKKVESRQVQADAWQSIKDFFGGLWESFKNLISPVQDTLAELQSVLETQVEPLLAEPVTAAKKEQASDFESYVKRIQKLTDENNHAQAMATAAKAIGDETLEKLFNLVSDIQEVENQLPSALCKYRNELYDRLIENAKVVLAPEQFEALQGAM